MGQDILERTFSERYLLRSNFATLNYQKISQRSVHAGCIIPVCHKCIPIVGPNTFVAYTLYNTQWRGLAELLISIEWQCEGLGCGISKEVSPTSFLFPDSMCELMPKQGGVVGERKW